MEASVDRFRKLVHNQVGEVGGGLMELLLGLFHSQSGSPMSGWVHLLFFCINPISFNFRVFRSEGKATSVERPQVFSIII